MAPPLPRVGWDVGWGARARGPRGPPAEAGHSGSMGCLAWCCEHGKGVREDQREAAFWYQRGAQAGDLRSMYRWALCNETGAGVPQNLDQAVEWYRKAADLAHGPSMYRLGRCYEMGSGVPRDEKEARHWYYEGMRAGSQQAREAWMGDGAVTADALEPAELDNLQAAARKGEPDAMYRLALRCEAGTDMSPDPDQAVHWYR